MEIILKERQDCLKVQEALLTIIEQLKEKPYVCEIKPYRQRRSLDANAYFHVLVDKIAKSVNR